MILSFVWLAAALAQHQVPIEPDERPQLGVANYLIEATLDPELRTVEGEQQIQWRNPTSHSTNELWIHLYLNAFRNNRSTFALERGRSFWSTDGAVPADYWGSVEILSLEVEPLGSDPPNAVVSREFAQPDDGNSDDQTVLRLQLAEAIPPDGRIELKTRFRAKLPRGVARTGWVEDYFFGAQWFPKLGVFEEGRWNCHQYHADTEYYADFGFYNVRLTVPKSYLAGGTGLAARRDNADGTATYTFQQDRVHDFAWVASPRFQVRSSRLVAGGLPNVSIRLLLQPEHEHLGDRYLRAVREALTFFGRWFGPYPYPQLTLVDPAYRSDTDGMEYPTLITGRAHFLDPPQTLKLESTAVHEVAHQWWYGVVANNEFEEAWLDEGLASWSESMVLRAAYSDATYSEDFLGGIPLLFDCLRIPFETVNLPPLRRSGTLDQMTQPSWRVADSRSYVTNSYAKPEMVLWTLYRQLGEETMRQVLQTYFQRFAFRHARTRDFIAVVNEVADQDLNWFFEQTFFSSESVDYSVSEVLSEEIPPFQGLPLDDSSRQAPAEPLFRTRVVVRRNGGARLPVEVLLEFRDGAQIRETWDGQARWTSFAYRRPVKLLRAVVDPDRKILLDIDPTNNSWVDREDQDRGWSTATWKWSSKWLFWIQNLLETFVFLG